MCDCAKRGVRTGSDALAKTESLRKIKDHPSNWNSLYRCPECGGYWEISHPGAGNVCCVEPELTPLTEKSAAGEYLL